MAACLEGHYPDLGKALVIHTKANGEISEPTSGKNKEEIDKLREEATSIDNLSSPYKAIVSVMMQSSFLRMVPSQHFQRWQPAGAYGCCDETERKRNLGGLKPRFLATF